MLTLFKLFRLNSQENEIEMTFMPSGSKTNEAES